MRQGAEEKYRDTDQDSWPVDLRPDKWFFKISSFCLSGVRAGRALAAVKE